MTFRFERHILNDVMDWFSGIRLFNEQVDTVDAKAMVNREAMVCWAIQYGRYVEVLGPADLREYVGQALREVGTKYKEE